ncbi:CPBP family intramembrane glutamic endopeptidase [Bifidobacterium xylocopae]|nr:type II CAAX endopeptidase family protein [Bifidobacterium xylocopae]
MRRSRRASEGQGPTEEAALAAQGTRTAGGPAPARASADHGDRRHPPVKQVRIALNEQSGALILYLVVMQLIGPAVAIAFIVMMESARHQPVSVDTALAQMDTRFAGVLNLVCVVSAFVFWILTHKRQIADPGSTGVFHRREHRMTPLVFLGAVALLLTGQAVSSVYDLGFNWVVEHLQLKVSTSSEAIQAASGSAVMFFYVSFFGPVVEEIVFRGVIMNALKRYGKVFAIITSAAMFGFFHSDLSQGLFAFLVGLVLGYVACEYSIFWSMLLHIVNNLLISNLGSLVISRLPSQAQDQANLGLLVFGALLGVLVLYLARERIRGFILANRAFKGIYASWAGLWFLVYLVLQVLLTTQEFTPLPA